MTTQATPKKKVLCIEDEHFISELYVRALQQRGYDTKVILSGEAGLQEAATGHYDIILLDLMIPGITGIEVLRRLKGPGSPEVKSKIIIATNLEVEESVRNELEQLADGYLIKAEITPHQLVDFLDKVKV